MSLFERFGWAYHLISDEDARWSKEGPMLLRLADVGRVLDLACGQGFHARRLAAEGLEVTGVDMSGPLLAAARGLPGGDRPAWILGRMQDVESLGLAGRFGLALILGNTLSLLTDDADARAALAGAAVSLVSGARLLIQTIDFAALPAEPKPLVREGEVEGRAVRIEKRLIRREGGAEIRFALDHDGMTEVETQLIIERSAERYRELASAVGLEFAGEWGGFDGSPREPGRTRDVIQLFKAL